MSVSFLTRSIVKVNPFMPNHQLKEIILKRRTRKPTFFSAETPDRKKIIELIEVARHAPNHHRTEPARFYLLDHSSILEVGKLFGQVVAGDGTDQSLVKKGEIKANQWGKSPGLLIVTSYTDRTSELYKKNPAVEQEDYATCSCICQNLLLLLEADGIACKWSTGPVWEHPKFSKVIQMQDSSCEQVVALLFYGYSEQEVSSRPLSPLGMHLVDHASK